MVRPAPALPPANPPSHRHDAAQRFPARSNNPASVNVASDIRASIALQSPSPRGHARSGTPKLPLWNATDDDAPGETSPPHPYGIPTAGPPRASSTRAAVVATASRWLRRHGRRSVPGPDSVVCEPEHSDDASAADGAYRSVQPAADAVSLVARFGDSALLASLVVSRSSQEQGLHRRRQGEMTR